ncbi:MAG: hypothetical protein K0R83_996 [Caulobacter sp.]|jgi:hypothetical protein|nr:hypothetical protein [Caulobacter sp.]
MSRKRLSNGQTVVLIILGLVLLLLVLLSPVGCAYLKMRQIQDRIGAEQDAARAAQRPIADR